MNITPFTIYLISRLTPIHDIAEISVVMSTITSIAMAAILLIISIEKDYSCDESVVIRKLIRWPIAALIMSVLVIGLVPTTKDAAAMIVIPRIANSQSVQELGESVVALAKAWCEELKPVNKDGGKK